MVAGCRWNDLQRISQFAAYLHAPGSFTYEKRTHLMPTGMDVGPGLPLVLESRVVYKKLRPVIRMADESGCLQPKNYARLHCRRQRRAGLCLKNKLTGAWFDVER